MMPTSGLFFAAGLGTRMAPLTDKMPKPMIPVLGKPLLDHALDLGADAGLTRPVVNVHYKADQIRTHLSGTDVAISDESDLLRDTGGGLKHALPLLNASPVFTMNTDAVWSGGNPFDELRAAWRDDMDALLLLIHPSQAHGHLGKGDFIPDAEGRLTPGPGLIYSGAQIVRTDRLRDVGEEVFSMWRLWDPIRDAGRMFGIQFSGTWCDVGRPDCLPLAEAMLQQS